MSRSAASGAPNDPSTATDDETIHRVLFVAGRVHVYAIPPLQSTKGHVAAGWTTNPQHQIFTGRLRVVESSRQAATHAATTQAKGGTNSGGNGISASLLLEDASSGELFAAAPYTAASVVEAATDSARFFAVRVVGDGGRKATLGIGFEERGEALDFGLALTEARRALGWEGAGAAAGAMTGAWAKKKKDEPKKDWGLKDGETLTVDLKGLRRRSAEGTGTASWTVPEGGGLVPPPPAPASGLLAESASDEGVGAGLLPPPTSAREARAERRRSREIPSFVQEEEKRKLEALGFDDGEFGEFQ